MFSCVFVTFPYGVLGRVLYLIVSIPDLCLFSYFFLIFLSYSGPFGSDGKQISLKPVLGCIRIVALSISSHEQTQYN